jgi:hypothetical protein
MGRRAFALAAVIVLSTSKLHAQDLVFTVSQASVDVHRSPSTGSPVIGKAARGRVFDVTRELGSWVRIAWPEAEDGSGYLHMTFGTISRRSAPQLTAQPDAGRLAPGVLVTSVGEHTVPSPETIAAAQRINPRPVTNPVPRSTVSLPSHSIGVGARMGTEALGFAATGRAWGRGPLGVQLEAGRSTYSSPLLTERVSSMQIAPSFVYALPNMVSNALWARPYLGSGLNLYRSSLQSRVSSVSDTVDTGIGAQIFGGAEFTLASVPQLAVSADLRHAWAPTPFSGFEMGGFGFSLSAHWYVR